MCIGHHGYYYSCPECDKHFWYEWDAVKLSRWNIYFGDGDCDCREHHYRFHNFRNPLAHPNALCDSCDGRSHAVRARYSGPEFGHPPFPVTYPMPQSDDDIFPFDHDAADDGHDGPLPVEVSAFEFERLFPPERDEIDEIIEEDVYPQEPIQDGEPVEQHEVEDEADEIIDAIFYTSDSSDEGEPVEQHEVEDEDDGISEEEIYPQDSIEEGEPVEQHEAEDEGSDDSGSVVTMISTREYAEIAESPEESGNPLEVDCISVFLDVSN